MRRTKNNKKSTIFALMLSLVVFFEILAPAVMAADDPLVMGVFPRRNATLTTRLFTPMAEHLSQQLGREVRLVTAKDFPSFWRGVSDRSYDIVHYNQYHYTISADAYEVIAHNKEFGRSDVAGSLYVRSDSGITEVSQLAGRRIMFGGGEDAMMSYILPRYLLLEAGLDNEDYEARFANSPPNAMMALYFNQAEASGAGDILIDLPVVKRNINTAELTHLVKTEPLLHLPWAVKRGMNSQLRQEIQQSLVQLEQTEKGRAVLKQAKMTGFGTAEDKDYDPHRRIIAKVMGSEKANH
ncbi:MAG: PhnD/SsuA/transferrin family substrate-binding protein [Motiliproteus sp.]